MKDQHVKGVAQDVAEGVAEDVPQEVTHGFVFGGPGGARPPRHATTAVAAFFAQLATCLDGGATGQLSGIGPGCSGQALHSNFLIRGCRAKHPNAHTLKFILQLLITPPEVANTGPGF